MGNGNFKAEGHARLHSAVSCAKMAERIQMPFGLWSRVGRRKHVLHGEHIDTTWQIQLNHPCATAMRSYQITLTTCCCMEMMKITPDFVFFLLLGFSTVPVLRTRTSDLCLFTMDRSSMRRKTTFVICIFANVVTFVL